jgi:hypothetical protein
MRGAEHRDEDLLVADSCRFRSHIPDRPQETPERAVGQVELRLHSPGFQHQHPVRRRNGFGEKCGLPHTRITIEE